LAVLERAREAVRRSAPLFPAIRAAHLFGALLQPGGILPDTDVEVAIDCDDVEMETPFWRMLEEALERNVLLVPRIWVAEKLKIQSELCYERQKL